MQVEYAEMMKWLRHNHPNHMNRWMDSLHPNQIRCKEWLVLDGLSKVQIPRNGQGKFNVEIIGGWFGYPLIQLLVDDWSWLQINRIDIFDIDPWACRMVWKYGDIFGWNNHIRIFNQDYFTYKEKRRTHLIINTSCEHMWNMDTMKEYYEEPERTLLALQSNDKTNEPDHINCVKTGQELAAQAGVKELYGGKMRFNEGTPDQYTRYMILGKWK